MHNKIFVFLIAGLLLISMFAFAIADENESSEDNQSLISPREQIKEQIREFRQNITQIRENWTAYKEQIKQQIKEDRMTYVRCVSDSAKAKNDCFNNATEKAAECRITAINNSDRNMSKQCNADYKAEKAECMKGFKETKKECSIAKHSFFDSLKAMFK
jgi:TolA-binding protein